MSNPTMETSRQHAVIVTANKMPAILAMVFGLFMIMGAGMAQIDAVHNAAHDVRHAFAFPCH